MAPVYDYGCVACGARLEQVRKMSDPPLAACPHCGGEVRRVYGVAPVGQAEAVDAPVEAAAPADAVAPPGEPALDIQVPWVPTETDIHREWKQRRKWKRDLIARNKWNERTASRRGTDEA